MATGKFSFYSLSLNRSTSFNIVLPNDLPPIMKQGNKNYEREMKTLILLHGFSGTDDDWVIQGNAATLAGMYNMAVITPNGYNSFYLDKEATGNQYGTFIGQELLDYCIRTFGLSDKKEDTFIGGYSMGGFGALHVALQFPDRFSKVMALSSALIIHQIAGMKEDAAFDGMANYQYYRDAFGDLDKLEETENNPEVLVRNLKAAGKSIPDIYMAIGTEDFLYQNNQQFLAFLKEEDVTVTYEEGPGNHDFDFWSKYAIKGIEWMLR